MPEMPEIGVAEAMASLIKLQSWLAAAPYVDFVKRGLLTETEAAAALRWNAETVDQLTLAAPHVGAAVAVALRDYAACFDAPPGRVPHIRPVPDPDA
jgi:hypothetical protein